MFPGSFFKSPEKQRREDEAWLAARGGKRPKPYGVYLIVCMFVSPYLLIRTEMGLPKAIALVLESQIVQSSLKVLALVSVLVSIGWFFHFIVSGFTVRTPYWEIRYGENNSRSIPAMFMVLWFLIAFEAFFWVLQIVEWIIEEVT